MDTSGQTSFHLLPVERDRFLITSTHVGGNYAEMKEMRDCVLPSHHSAVPSKKGELSNSGFGVPELDNSRDRLPVLGDPLPRRTWGQMPLISAGLRSARGGRSYIGVVLWGLSNSGRFVLKKGKK